MSIKQQIRKLLGIVEVGEYGWTAVIDGASALSGKKYYPAKWERTKSSIDKYLKFYRSKKRCERYCQSLNR